jgi:phosphoserine phosphatase
VLRLQAWIDAMLGDRTEVELWAYGDDSGDRDLLATADHPTWIKRERR